MPWQEAEEAGDLVCTEAAAQMSPIIALTEQSSRRGIGYWILSQMFLEVPNALRLRDLRRMMNAEAADPADLASVEIAELCRRLDEAVADPDEAAVAYTRHLVVGDRTSGEPLPYEAHFLEGVLPGECTRQVGEMMHEAGFADVADGASSPDHLGAELRFMALLCYKENRAWQAGRNTAAAEYLRLQQRFMREHLARWVPAYCAALAERTSNGYLRALAKLTASTVRDDAPTADEICSWIAPYEFSTVPRTEMGLSPSPQ
jgi:TorA maturation chaperone TorD